MEIQFLPSESKYANDFLEYRLDPITKKYNPLMNQSLDELKKRLDDSCSDLKLFENKDSFSWFIAVENQLVGTASIQNINRTMQTAEIGYGVFSNHRGKSYGSKIVHELTKNVFSKTNLRKLIAFVHEKNTPSRRILEKVGYVQEGILREHYIVNGSPANEVIYGVLRREIK